MNYFVDPLDESKLRELPAKASLRPREVMRTHESVYDELGLAEADLPAEELIRLIVEHPDLVQRPIVERGDRAVLARPEKVLELLD